MRVLSERLRLNAFESGRTLPHTGIAAHNGMRKQGIHFDAVFPVRIKKAFCKA